MEGVAKDADMKPLRGFLPLGGFCILAGISSDLMATHCTFYRKGGQLYADLRCFIQIN